jgi:ligand-binding sensor domain-containing protein
MRPSLKIVSTLFFLFILFWGNCQFPAYFNITTEDNLPSNEVYSILQDRDGYIWIGCDAGIYRYNGIKFEHLESDKLSARSATGLYQSKSGRIYAYNFNSQVFYIENDELKVLEGWNSPVTGITEDGNGKVWISSSERPFIIDEATLTWSFVKSSEHIEIGGKIFTDNIKSNIDGTIFYHNYNKVIEWKKGKATSYSIDSKFKEIPLVISRSSRDPWLFDVLGGEVFKKVKSGWVKYENKELGALLKGRKTNNVIETDDGVFWICTHSGLIRFNKHSGKSELLYDNLAFSDCILDREGNYWFTTLQNGIIRIPQFEVKIWNVQSGAFTNDLFSNIVLGDNSVFFAGSAGMVGKLTINSKALFKNEHTPKSDVGMFYYDPIDKCLYFNKMNQIYRYKDDKIVLVNNSARPIKSMLHTEKGYFLLSSQGLYFTKKIEEVLDKSNQLSPEWFREIELSPFSETVFIASNSGLFEFEFLNNHWIKKKNHLKEKQIISISSCIEKKIIYLLTFDGTIYSLSKNGKPQVFMKLDEELRPEQLRINKGKIYLATNQGIMTIDPNSKQTFLLDKYRGLASNNIHSLAFSNNNCWTATGKGIQQIPLSIFNQTTQSCRIGFREFRVNGLPINPKGTIGINYNDEVSLIADGFSYRSNGNFQFAYKIKGYSADWIVVPGSVGEIKIPSLPSGFVTIELKLIDHGGIDSENLIQFQLKVHPPFFQRWWFYVLIILIVGGMTYLYFKQRIQSIRKKQRQELRRIHLENELRLTQQNALKAQMNPHFLFNVLNSIKGYIYENDKKNAAKYLNDFSNLVRKVLELSSEPLVSLEKELEALRLYIELEEMLLINDFSHTIEIDENVDVSCLKMPALLIQPYVENAFKHGLRHKLGDKKLDIQISYNEHEEILTIRIDDNGIGRKSAEETNLKMHKDHQSFATSAMERRLQLLNHEKKGVVGVEIVDKFDRGANSEGTTVIIRIHV